LSEPDEQSHAPRFRLCSAALFVGVTANYNDALAKGRTRRLEGEGVRFAALLVAAFTIAVGTAGLVAPDRATTVRRLYFATATRQYSAAAVRAGMGLVLILAAAASRAPKTLRVLGAVMCMQALSATLLGPDHARAILEWETRQGTTVLRVGSAVALIAGGFIAFAVTGERPENR